MAVYATPQEVANRWGRSLTDAQMVAAEMLLEEASAGVDLLVPGLAAQLDAQPALALVARRIVADAVKAVLSNPDIKVQESIDDYSFRRPDSAARAALFIADDDVELLRDAVSPIGSTRGAFTIRPGRR